MNSDDRLIAKTIFIQSLELFALLGSIRDEKMPELEKIYKELLGLGEVVPGEHEFIELTYTHMLKIREVFQDFEKRHPREER